MPVSQERIVLLDPLGSLSHYRDLLSRPGLGVETLQRFEDLLLQSREASTSLSCLVVVLDGDRESGLEPLLSARLIEAAPELPPVALAVVQDPERGRAWTSAGAAGYLLRPVDAENLRLEVDRWLRFSERLTRSLKRVEALRTFFAMFAHDLKNPLNAIAGYCELMEANPLIPREATEDLQKIRRNLHLLSTMAEGLLEMVRGNARLRITPRETDLQFVVRQAVEMLRVRALQRGIVIQVLVEGPTALLRLDASRIIEALANVLDNAIKFSPERSLIQVGVSTGPHSVLITVDDEGPGIPPTQREEVFERFGHAATHGAHGGLGLGLSIARDIVELHGGSIWAEGRAPRGTRIALSFPRAGSESVGQAAAAEELAGLSAPPAPGRKEGAR